MKKPKLKKYLYGHILMLLNIILLILLSSCNDGNPIDGGGIKPPLPIPPVSYYHPAWHPNGKIIGFKYGFYP